MLKLYLFQIWNQSVVPCPVITVLLTCIQISQEASQVVCYSHLLKNFPHFVVIHTVKSFGIVNKAEVDVFLELSCFLMIQWMSAIWSLVPLPFLSPAWTYGNSRDFWPLLVFHLHLEAWKGSDDLNKCSAAYGGHSHRTGKGQFSFQSQRKAMPNNAQTTEQLHSSHTLVK